MAFLLTGGQVADCVAADALLDHLVSAEILHADKGYDSNAVRRKIEAMGAAPISRPRPTVAGNAVSRPISPVIATPSSACSAASRTSVASPPTSSPLSALPLARTIGGELERSAGCGEAWPLIGLS